MSEQSELDTYQRLENDPSWHRTLKWIGALGCLSGAILAGLSIAQGEYVLAGGCIGGSAVLGNMALNEAQIETRVELGLPTEHKM